MPVMDMRCLYSTVRNISGRTANFQFLPPHGRKLGAEEEYSVMGDLVSSVIRMERVTSQRDMASLQSALNDGLLDIVKTPNPILEDEVLNDSKMLVLKNGNLAVTDPCWTSESDSTDEDE